MARLSTHSSLLIFALVILLAIVVFAQIAQFSPANATDTNPRDSEDVVLEEDDTEPDTPTPDGDPDEPLRVLPDDGRNLFALVWFLMTMGI